MGGSAPLTETAAPPRWPTRVLALAFYLGLAPLLALSGLHRRSAYLRHHLAQAVALVALLAAILLCGLLGFVAIAYLIVYHEAVYKGYPVEEVSNIVWASALLAWAVAWLLAVGLALKGSTWAVPLLGRLTRSKGRRGLAWTANVVLGLFVVTVGGVSLHASAITREGGPAPVSMLYDDYSGWMPRCLMALGFYRITLAAHERFGPESVVVAPLTDANLRTALQHSRFVFLACHGAQGDITTRDLVVGPMQYPGIDGKDCRLYTVQRQPGEKMVWRLDYTRPVVPGDHLQFVYNTACDAGVKDALWQEALAPAAVRTFAHTSAVGEHILWLWLVGPQRVQKIE